MTIWLFVSQPMGMTASFAACQIASLELATNDGIILDHMIVSLKYSQFMRHSHWGLASSAKF